MKNLNPPKEYDAMVRPVITKHHPDWKDDAINDAVQKHWETAPADVKLIYVKPIVNEVIKRMKKEVREQFTKDVCELLVMQDGLKQFFGIMGNT